MISIDVYMYFIYIYIYMHICLYMVYGILGRDVFTMYFHVTETYIAGDFLSFS